MNGEIYQTCFIVVAAKKALSNKINISYAPLKYEHKIEFQFLSEGKLFSKKPYQAENVPAWYNHCLEKGLSDIFFTTPTSVKDRAFLGYSNANQNAIVCSYSNNITFFTAQWRFDSSLSKWNILYTEQEWRNAPSEKPHFDNNTESFEKVLLEIKELAHKIGCDYFADLFQKAVGILSGSYDYLRWDHKMPLPDIPVKNLPLFKAADIADVFGAMGSWNDSPPYMTHEKGLDKEYESLSDELLKQNRFALLYAINEW